KGIGPLAACKAGSARNLKPPCVCCFYLKRHTRRRPDVTEGFGMLPDANAQSHQAVPAASGIGTAQRRPAAALDAADAGDRRDTHGLAGVHDPQGPLCPGAGDAGANVSDASAAGQTYEGFITALA